MATWTDRSPIRSSSLTIRSAETIIRRSPATGCCRESSAKALSSMRSRLASMASSALITCSAVATSPVSSALVASAYGDLDLAAHLGEVGEDGIELVMEGLTHAAHC